MFDHYYIYILSNKRNGTLYTGFTNDLGRRVSEHKEKTIEGFTKKYNVVNLVYYEIVEGFMESVKREKQIKRWKREWKISLIEENNPEWKDLYNEFLENQKKIPKAEW